MKTVKMVRMVWRNTVMKMATSLALSAAVLVGACGVASADDELLPARTHVGEVRSFAIPASNVEAVAEMRRHGWLEARGQILSASAFPKLFRVLGRAWTAGEVEEGFFAVPELRDRSQPHSANPFGVLNPGDLVTRGETKTPPRHHAPLSYWIFVGQDASHAGTRPTARR
jgi:hypothetical protein